MNHTQRNTKDQTCVVTYIENRTNTKTALKLNCRSKSLALLWE